MSEMLFTGIAFVLGVSGGAILLAWLLGSHVRVIYVVGGQSASGKDTFLRLLRQQKRARKGITTTDRPMRPGEVDGEDYDFVTTAVYRELDAAGKLAEKSPYLGNAHYGITWERLEEGLKSDVPTIWILDYLGLQRMRELFPGQVASVFLWAPKLVLAERLLERGETEETIVKRLATYQEERDRGIALYDANLSTANLTPEEVARNVMLQLRLQAIRLRLQAGWARLRNDMLIKTKREAK